MSARRQEMNFTKIEQIVAQRVANAIEAIVAYETTLRMTHDLIDKVVPQVTTMARSVNNKRKWENNSRDNCVPQPSCKRQNGARTYNARTNEKKAYAGSLPYYNKCKWHHDGPCFVKCDNCNRIGHMTKDCKVPVAATIQRNPVAKQGVVVTCYECGNRGHVKSDCPKTKNQNCRNQIWKGKARENLNFAKDKTYA
ncbi:reverse transcriptase domain-containing protein [Tanacetum coccineum]